MAEIPAHYGGMDSGVPFVYRGNPIGKETDQNMVNVRIEKKNGKLDVGSRQIMANWFNGLQDGYHEVSAKTVADLQYQPTRYKYLFDCVYQLCLPSAARVYRVLEGGDPRPIRTVEELHYCMKAVYNPVHCVNIETGQVLSNALTTTALSDRDFAKRFLDEILVEFSSPPHNLEIPTREEWRDMRESFEWEDFKVRFFEEHSF